MGQANQVFPYANVTPLASGDAFAASGLEDVVVFAGPATRGAYTPKLLGAQDTATLVATYGSGPTVKRCARAMSKVSVPVVFLRLPNATITAGRTDPTVVKNGSSTIAITAGSFSGTPTDGADVVVKIGTVGGQTGTGPIAYQVSLDGGANYGAVQALGIATSITVLGSVLALGSGKTVTAGDTIAWLQWPASQSIGALTTTRINALTTPSTSVVTASGVPLDACEVRMEVLTGGTIGTAGVVVRYSLDGLAPSPTWTTVALGTANALALLDGPTSTEPSGITLNFAAGTLDAGDYVVFAATGPAYDPTGLAAGINYLKAWGGTWTWIRACGPVTAAQAGTISTTVQALDAANLPAWCVVDARDRYGSESIAAWSARVDAEWAQFTSLYVAPCKGMARMADPINQRSNRHPSFDACAPRAMAAPIHVDWGEYDLGPLPADVSIWDANNNVVEYDSNSDPNGVKMGFIALRTWPNAVGVYPAGACMMGPSNDYNRVPLRRVKCVADRILAQAIRGDVLKGIRTIPQGQTQTLRGYAKLMAGDIDGADIERINRVVTQALDEAVGPRTGRTTAVSYRVNKTPTRLGGGALGLTGQLKINNISYVVAVDATSQFVR